MLGFKDRYQLNKWKLMGTGHAAEMKEGDRKGWDTPWPHFGQGVSVTRGALKQNLQTKLYLSIVG